MTTTMLLQPSPCFHRRSVVLPVGESRCGGGSDARGFVAHRYYYCCRLVVARAGKSDVVCVSLCDAVQSVTHFPPLPTRSVASPCHSSTLFVGGADGSSCSGLESIGVAIYSGKIDGAITGSRSPVFIPPLFFARRVVD